MSRDECAAATPLLERLAAMEVEVSKVTTEEDRKAQEGQQVRTSNLLTDFGRAQLCALLREAREAIRDATA